MADHERPLGPRGQRDAVAVGEWLAANVAQVDLVLCSPSARTRRTWALATQQLPTEPPVRQEPDVYLGTLRTLHDLVRTTDDGVHTLVVVGHNPGTQELALLLAGSGDSNQLARMRSKFPTSGLAVLRSTGSWKDLTEGTARLVEFTVPRG
jgi:phosphohistidine phosphatase